MCALSPHPGESATLELDASTVTSVTGFVASLPEPIGDAEQTQPAGAQIFRDIGCAACHTPSLAGVPPYSDLLLHDMGDNLNDGVTQGLARGQDWRTAPLWGLRDRPRYLNDDRATTLPVAIRAHAGKAAPAMVAYSSLSDADRGALLVFRAAL
jgi:CxxC motif-containing protein (DUF1111 family)